jgi:hypothetical protein
MIKRKQIMQEVKALVKNKVRWEASSRPYAAPRSKRIG